MKKEMATKIYSDVFESKIDEGKNINSWLKAVIVNFGCGDICVKNDNFGTRRKYADFTNGKSEAGLNPIQIVFTGLDVERMLGGRYINKNDEVCVF